MLQSQTKEVSKFLLSLFHWNHSSYLEKKLRKRRVKCRNPSRFKKTNRRKVSEAWGWAGSCFPQAMLWSDSQAYNLTQPVLKVLKCRSMSRIPRCTSSRKLLWKNGKKISLGKLWMTEKCAQLSRQFWLIQYLSWIRKAARKAGSPHWEQDISETLANVRYPSPTLSLCSESTAFCFLSYPLLATGHNLNCPAKAILFLESWPKTSKPQLPLTFLLLISHDNCNSSQWKTWL